MTLIHPRCIFIGCIACDRFTLMILVAICRVVQRHRDWPSFRSYPFCIPTNFLDLWVFVVSLRSSRQFPGSNFKHFTVDSSHFLSDPYMKLRTLWQPLSNEDMFIAEAVGSCETCGISGSCFWLRWLCQSSRQMNPMPVLPRPTSCLVAATCAPTSCRSGNYSQWRGDKALRFYIFWH